MKSHDDIAIKVQNLSKCYQIYDAPQRPAQAICRPSLATSDLAITQAIFPRILGAQRRIV